MKSRARHRILHGKYEILGEAAVGGMGEVYMARHRLLGEHRAIKVMRASSALDPKLRERFLREARTAARLRHANLVQLYDLAFHEDGHAYMVLEWIEGLDLSKLLREYGPPPLRDSLNIAQQALSALDYLHGEGIAHRDVSADNLMVALKPDGELEVKLIDLGIAKSMNSVSGLTKTGLFVGKLHYAAPETLAKDQRSTTPDHRSDLYSFGVVLYEMLTGVGPITGSSESELLAGHLLHPPRSFTETDPEDRVPEDLRQVVLKALHKEPADRFQSAAELARALAAIQTPAEHEWRTAELHRTITLATESLRPGGEILVARGEELEPDGSSAGKAGAGETSDSSPGEPGDTRPYHEGSAEREIWFENLRRSYVRREHSHQRSSFVQLIQTHPKPVALGASALVLLVLVSFAGFLRGGEPPPPSSPAVETEGQGPPEVTEQPPDTAAPLREPAEPVITPIRRGIALISDNAQLASAVAQELDGRVAVVVRASLGEAMSEAAGGAGARFALDLSAVVLPGSVEAYDTLLQTCEAVVSGRVLALPGGTSLFARTVQRTAPRCGEAVAEASRELAKDLAARIGDLTAAR